jgi:hypothetical protein
LACLLKAMGSHGRHQAGEGQDPICLPEETFWQLQETGEKAGCQELRVDPEGREGGREVRSTEKVGRCH